MSSRTARINRFSTLDTASGTSGVEKPLRSLRAYRLELFDSRSLHEDDHHEATEAVSARALRKSPQSTRALRRVPQQAQDVVLDPEGTATMSTRPDHALFEPEYCLPGILRCQAKGCGELFITSKHIRSLTKELKAEGRPTKWLGTVEAEQQRRRVHAEAHVRRCEVTLDRATGFFLLAKHLRPTPKAVTAADFGFTRESA